MTRLNRTIIPIAGIALLVSAVRAQVGGGLDLTWNTIDAGGITRSTGGGFELSGTIGQLDAGRLSGGDLELTGGFWFEIVPADCNEDGAVTLFDFADFATCLFGPQIPDGVGPLCACFDLDGNAAIDLADFALLQNGLSTP